MNLVIATNFSMAIHDNVRLQYGTLTNFNMGSNNTKGPMWALAPILAPSSTMAVG